MVYNVYDKTYQIDPDISFHLGEFFSLFKSELGQDFKGTFGILDKTIEYLRSKDNEYIGKLFPEEREVVEELIKRIEKKKSGD